MNKETFSRHQGNLQTVGAVVTTAMTIVAETSYGSGMVPGLMTAGYFVVVNGAVEMAKNRLFDRRK